VGTVQKSRACGRRRQCGAGS